MSIQERITNMKMVDLKKFNFEVVIAAILFIIAVVMDKMMDMIIYMLYFIIFVEIVRAVLGYIQEERVLLRFLVDAFIVLALREFIVNVVKINKYNIESFELLLSNPISINLVVLAVVILFLFFVRYLAMKISPSNMKKYNEKQELKE